MEKGRERRRKVEKGRVNVRTWIEQISEVPQEWSPRVQSNQTTGRESGQKDAVLGAICQVARNIFPAPIGVHSLKGTRGKERAR